MTHDEKINQMEQLFNACLQIADAKGRDYSGVADGLGNLRDFGSMGIIVRLGDKYHRAKHIIQSSEVHVKDESLRDTLQDMINYAALAILMLDEEGATL